MSPETPAVRHDWTKDELTAIYDAPFANLIYLAQSVHRAHFPANEVQISMLLSIKTGGCKEDCGYCSQSAKAKAGVKATKLMEIEAVLEKARAAKAAGATRFCMGAAWREPKDKDLDQICEMIRQVRALGMETCVTLGMLTDDQVERLRQAGLDYYNHNLDTSPEYYGKVISTRTYQDRLDTLKALRAAGIHVCCGGIIGMGEEKEDRIGLIHKLATLEQHPESVPINMLMRIAGTQMEDAPPIDPFELIRTIATARIAMPKSFVRLSAGRENMNEQTQALCFIAGANSIFSGEKLLTTNNPGTDKDSDLLARLGIKAMVL